MTEQTQVPHPAEHGEKPRESNALTFTVGLLQKKWLVIGVPVVALATAGIIIGVAASRRKIQNKAAEEYLAVKLEKKSEHSEKYMAVYGKYRKTAYGQYALARVAKLALDKRDYSKAKELSEKFLEEFPDNHFAIFVKRYIGLALEGQGRYKEAKDLYREILENDPRMSYISDALNIDIGRCYEQMGEYELAKSYYQKVSPSSGARGAFSPAGFKPRGPEALGRISRVDRKIKLREAEEEKKREAEEEKKKENEEKEEKDEPEEESET